MKQILLLSAFLGLGLTACKKTPTPAPDPPTTSRADLSRDSIFLYAKEIYLWSDALPSYETFNPRKYTTLSTDFDNYEKELIALTQYKINPTTKLPYEYFASGTDSKYSYIADKADKNPVAFAPNEKSSVDLEGNGNDFGFRLTAFTDPNSTAYALFISAVFQNSPADKAGLIRSNRITKVNGRVLGDNYNNDVAFLNNAINANTLQMEYVKYENGITNGVITVANLTKGLYKSSPIYAAKVITSGAKKIGYLAYARFSTLTNSQAGFDEAFADFNTRGVTDLIIDLRYNGGGYVNTAEYLINQIAPMSAVGAVMFSEHFNALMQSGGAKILENQPYLDENYKVQYQNGKMITYADLDYSVTGNTQRFQKSGPLNRSNTISNIVFIVSGGTASASELVINSLKPYMNVKLVGTKTYGKPVGFSPMTIENKYDVYYSLFQTKNANGEGDYFDGMTPDIVDDYDDPLYNFGDADENYTAKAISLLAPGATIAASKANKTMSIAGKNVMLKQLGPAKSISGGGEFVGMIETNHKLKK
ncbi:MAG: S41 family peptidase [Bacteroidota bacterium]